MDARELQGRPTGTGRYLRNLLRRWAGGPDRIVLYFNGAAPADPVLAAPGIETRVVGGGRRGLLWAERDLPRAAHADGLDVFLAPAYTCPLRLRVPRVTAVHDVSYFHVPEDFPALDGARRRLLVGASVRASRAVLACSDFSRREIGALFPDARGRVQHVPLAAADDLPPAPPRGEARRGLGVEGPYVLTVGAVFGRRNVPVLVRAAASLAARWPDLVLDVAGENRTHPRIDLRLRARAAPVDVRLSGFVGDEELAARYAAADVAVFLSRYEGFGLPALEAMARGVPVVASAAPALGEVFAPAALLVPPDDERAVAGAVARVIQDRALRADLVARGLALAARYSWADTAARTRTVLLDAARGGP